MVCVSMVVVVVVVMVVMMMVAVQFTVVKLVVVRVVRVVILVASVGTALSGNPVLNFSTMCFDIELCYMDGMSVCMWVLRDVYIGAMWVWVCTWVLCGYVCECRGECVHVCGMVMCSECCVGVYVNV